LVEFYPSFYTVLKKTETESASGPVLFTSFEMYYALNKQLVMYTSLL